MKKNKSKIILVIILMIIGFFVGYYTVYAKYMTNINGNVTSRVAKISLSIDKTEATFPYELETDNYQSTTRYYKFKVTNKTNNKISEVALKYVLTLQATRNIPLDISIYNVNQTVYNETTTTSSNASSSNLIQSMTYPTTTTITSSGNFTAGLLQEVYYVIKINWNSNSQYQKEIYQNKIDLIKLNATFEQIV